MFPQIIIISPVSGLAPVRSFPLVASLAYCLCPVSFWTRISKSFQTVVISGKCQHDAIQMEQISLNGTICQSVSDAWAKSKLEPSQTHPEEEARQLSSELQSHRSECGRPEDGQRHALEVEFSSKRNRKSLLVFRSFSCVLVWVAQPPRPVGFTSSDIAGMQIFCE